MSRTIALLLGFITVFAVHAHAVGDQNPNRAITPTGKIPTQPGNAMTDLPIAVYQSALTGYRSFRDEKVSSWRASNDEVARIGGWRAYAREARQPELAPRDTPAAAGDPDADHGK